MGCGRGGDGAADGGVDLGVVNVCAGSWEIFVCATEELAWERHGGERHCVKSLVLCFVLECRIECVSSYGVWVGARRQYRWFVW